eukprot:m51a1_g2413 hypothetical protein (103) ;mRNA; r:797358-797666
MPGIKGRNETAVPPVPLKCVNGRGERVRVTFKLFTQELWLATAASTDRVPFSSIRAVVAEPIRGKEEYSIVALQLGSTEASRYFLYWVPSQFVRVIKQVLTF